MPVEERVIEKVRRLSPEQQEEVLRFVEFLELRQFPSLGQVIAQIRERAAPTDAAEVETLIEEAREEFFNLYRETRRQEMAREAEAS